MRTATLFLVGAALLGAGPAEACKTPVSRGELIASFLERLPPYDVAVEVNVLAVAPTPQGGWLATGQRVNIHADGRMPTEFEFGEVGLVISSCGSAFDPATPGERWRLLLVAREGAWEVVTAMPAGLSANGLLQIDTPERAPGPRMVKGLARTPRLTPRR